MNFQFKTFKLKVSKADVLDRNCGVVRDFERIVKLIYKPSQVRFIRTALFAVTARTHIVRQHH